MTSSRSGRTVSYDSLRIGLWLIPVAGIVGFLVFSYWMTAPDGSADVPGFADWVTSAVAMGSGIVYVLALIALLLGLLTLTNWLAEGPRRDLVLTGMVFGVIGIGFLLSALGAAVFGGAVVADAYIAGNEGVAPALENLSGGNFGTPVLIAFAIAVVAALVAGILLGIAIWQSTTLPKWSGVLFGLGFVLFITTTPVATHVGGVLLAAGGIWIIRSMGRRIEEPQGTSLDARPADAG